MTLKILEYFTSLDENDFKILLAIEQIMTVQSVAKLEEIAKKTDLSLKFTNKKIGYLDKLDILTAHRIEEQYENIILNYMGYDALAVNEMVKKNVLDGIGQPIGVGKESNVFTGILSNNVECALKFHKIGKTKFKSTKRKRDFFAKANYISKFFESNVNAKREVTALKRLAGIIPVPKLYGYNRHLIVMELIDGVELQSITDLSEEDYKTLYLELMNYIKIILNLNIIHGDLSPFNILVSKNSEGLKLTVIDWPQYVELDHPNALDILMTDINNIYSYFNKKILVEQIDIEIFATKLLNDARKNLQIGI